VDTAAEAGERVPPEYDNLVAKVMVHAGDREAAIDRLGRALDETEISGIQTTLPFHRFVASNASFRAGHLSTGWVGEHWDGPAAWREAALLAQHAAGLAALSRSRAAATAPASIVAPGDAGASDGAWHRAALEAAVDRWPR
jgi:acetyl/propionyl-CoA carboxylase alpha subunit